MKTKLGFFALMLVGSMNAAHAFSVECIVDGERVTFTESQLQRSGSRQTVQLPRGGEVMLSVSSRMFYLETNQSSMAKIGVSLMGPHATGFASSPQHPSGFQFFE